MLAVELALLFSIVIVAFIIGYKIGSQETMELLKDMAKEAEEKRHDANEMQGL